MFVGKPTIIVNKSVPVHITATIVLFLILLRYKKQLSNNAILFSIIKIINSLNTLAVTHSIM